MSGAYNDKLVIFIKTQYLSYLIIKIPDVIAVTLLSEPTEAVEVLPDLRGGDMHPFGKFPGTDAHFTFPDQDPQISEIARQTADDGIRNVGMICSVLQSGIGFSL